MVDYMIWPWVERLAGGIAFLLIQTQELPILWSYGNETLKDKDVVKIATDVELYRKYNENAYNQFINGE